MHEVLQKTLGLRAEFGNRAQMIIQTMDVDDAFRPFPVDSDGAAACGYLFVDFGFQFGWRGSPGWC